jgi:hypothetical protein
MTTLTRAAMVAATFTLLAAPHARAQSSSIRVTIASGPHAGTYELKEQCEMQADRYPAVHIMAFTTGVQPPKTPKTMEFFLASAKGKPDGFVVSVQFLGRGGRYEIFAIPRTLSPSAPPISGKGTVTVKQTAAGKTMTFRGQTKEGVKMEGTVECRNRSS